MLGVAGKVRTPGFISPTHSNPKLRMPGIAPPIPTATVASSPSAAQQQSFLIATTASDSSALGNPRYAVAPVTLGARPPQPSRVIQYAAASKSTKSGAPRAVVPPPTAPAAGPRPAILAAAVTGPRPTTPAAIVTGPRTTTPTAVMCPRPTTPSAAVPGPRPTVLAALGHRPNVVTSTQPAPRPLVSVRTSLPSSVYHLPSVTPSSPVAAGPRTTHPLAVGPRPATSTILGPRQPSSPGGIVYRPNLLTRPAMLQRPSSMGLVAAGQVRPAAGSEKLYVISVPAGEAGRLIGAGPVPTVAPSAAPRPAGGSALQITPVTSPKG